jgi:hypothetical protein
MLAVVEYVRKFPLVTNVELAAALGTSRENAGKALRRFRRQEATKGAILKKVSLATEGSALAKLIQGPTPVAPAGTTISGASDEQRFIALTNLIGLARADELVKQEVQRARDVLAYT